MLHTITYMAASARGAERVALVASAKRTQEFSVVVKAAVDILKNGDGFPITERLVRARFIELAMMASCWKF